MLLRSVAIRKSVFLAIWNSTLAARILLRSSFISLTFRPWVCTRIATVARPSFSVSSSIFSAFACVGIDVLFLLSKDLQDVQKNGLQLRTEGQRYTVYA